MFLAIPILVLSATLTTSLRFVTTARKPPRQLLAAAPQLHVHFGAGRLGLGLVVPAIYASGVSFAVIERLQPNWMALQNSDNLNILVNNVTAVPGLKIIEIRNNTDLPSELPGRSLIFCDDTSTRETIVRRATTMSCSMGGAMYDVLSSTLASIPEKQEAEQPILFCCENDHAAVKRLKSKLQGRVRVVDCVVDKVCMGRTIGSGFIEIESEMWKGSIVALEPSLQHTIDIPFSREIITLPTSQRHAEYLSKRKLG
jgi:hypothetical protein